MFRRISAATALAILIAGPALARGGTPTERDCVDAGFFEIVSVSSSLQARTPNGAGGGFLYTATIRTRDVSPRGFRVVFSAPGATSTTSAVGYSLANDARMDVRLGWTPAGAARLTDDQIRQYTSVRCLA
ncbi:hypothetical protein ACE7GA_25230 [Roseomonas sp. CCTCC AB2023176]|uniref:hypothetical protein n=1 Tax=Roseomonas sp. CCTCC AB2023176 TaxID=3342640 RepID=UPI0035D7A93A